MGRTRIMPSRSVVYEYWKDKLDNVINDNTCFKCGFTTQGITSVERAHIEPVCDGGSDDVSNIHLLCKNCHTESEAWTGEIYDLWLKKRGYTQNDFKMCLASNVYFGTIELPKDKLHSDFCKTIKSKCNEFIEKHGKERCDRMMKEYL